VRLVGGKVRVHQRLGLTCPALSNRASRSGYSASEDIVREEEEPNSLHEDLHVRPRGSSLGF